MKSRKSRKVSRKSRKVLRKSRKVSRKSRKVSRKSRKVLRKSRKVSRKSGKFDSGIGSSKPAGIFNLYKSLKPTKSAISSIPPVEDPKLKGLLQRLYKLPGVLEYYTEMKKEDIYNIYKNRNDKSKKDFKEYKEKTTVKAKKNLSKDVNSYIKNNNIKNLEEKEEEIKNYILELIKE